jgi:UDP-N-acetylmuramate--alanine ligase
LNAAAALALTCALAEQEGLDISGGGPIDTALHAALEAFTGSKRRSEILGEAGGILFMDDYAHHPTAIKTTLAGLRDFYPKRRLVVSFMPHTYSRTAALLDDFAASFACADVLFLHKIYASAREVYSGTINDTTLFEKTQEHHGNVHYARLPEDARIPLKSMLKAGDLFLTMGAGDNWKLGASLYDFFARAGS